MKTHRNFFSLVGSVSLLLLVSGAWAQDIWSESNGLIHSAVKDSSTMNSTTTAFGVRLDHDTDDADVFLNNVNIVGGSSWNPLLNMQSSSYYYGFTNGVFGQAQYDLGTAITEDVSWDFSQLAFRNGEVDSSVDTGFYDFTLEVVGGTSSSSTEILASFDFQIEVVDTITASLTSSMSPNSIGWGEDSTASVTMANTGTRELITKTWYVAGFGLNGPYTANQLEFRSFEGNWFGQVIEVDESRTDLHSKWRANPGNVAGTYFGDIGVYGGIYAGDEHSWRPNASLQVVPEPASLTAMGLGLAALLRRRRK